MKIAVLGAGAMGSVIGGLLKNSGEDVFLIRTRKDWVDAINASGLRISEEGKSDLVVKIAATTDPRTVGVVDLVILMTKTPNTKEALSKAASIVGPDTLVLTLQNGLRNPETISEYVNPENIIAGTTTISSLSKEPGHVVNMHALVGSVNHIRKWRGENTEAVNKVAQTLSDAGMGTEILEDLDQLVWKKLLMACGIAGMTGITRLKLADLLAVDETMELARNTVRETIEVANKKGIDLDFDEEWERTVSVYRSAGPHITSLCYDVLNSQKTEIDSLNLGVVAEAEKLGMDAPYNRVIGSIVRIIERTYEKRL